MKLKIIIAFSLFLFSQNLFLNTNNIAFSQEIKQTDLDDANKFFDLGVKLQTEEKYSEALIYYFKAIKIKPDYIEVLNNIGQVYMSQRKLDDAIKYFQKTLDLNNNFSIGYYNTACAFSLKKDKNSSLKYLGIAIKLDKTLIDNAKSDKDLDFIKNQNLYKIIIGEMIPENDIIVKKENNIIEKVDILPMEEVKADIDKIIPKLNVIDRDSIAIIIGNKDYQNKDIPSVEYAIRDAQLMKEYLKNIFGYKEENIIYLQNADQTTFNTWFGNDSNPNGKLSSYIKPNKSKVFIYYSGHGAPDTKTGNGYFVPVNADPSVIELSGYSLKTFYNNLNTLNVLGITVVIDACFSGNSDKGMLIKNASPVFIKTTLNTEISDKISVFSSSSGEQISSWYPEKKHSLFTYYFLKALMLKGKVDEDGDQADLNNDNKISYEELFQYVNTKVSYFSKRMFQRVQTPQLINNKKEDFVKW